MKLNPKLFIDVIFPIGTSYITNNPSFNPNTAWGGTWVKDCEGQTIVGQKANDSDFGTLDDVVGEKTHTLTTNEMPSHSHGIVVKATWNGAGNTSSEYYNVSTGSGTDWNNRNWVNYANNEGGGQAHNNIQPSKIKIIWTRTA